MGTLTIRAHVMIPFRYDHVQLPFASLSHPYIDLTGLTLFELSPTPTLQVHR